MKVALVSGASSGIGAAIARKFADKGIALIICGRREARLQALKNELSSKVPVHVLCFDVADKNASYNALESIPSNFSDIDILVNNAGNAHGLGAVHEAEMADWELMIDINVKGLLYLSQWVSKKMVQKKRGQIINISSIAGKETYPGGNVYCASKSAVSAFTEAMRKDLYAHNIRVSSICPGLVETEFSEVRFKGDKDKASKVYQGYRPLQANDVAHVALYMVEAPEHVNIADVLILPTDQASATLVNRRN